MTRAAVILAAGGASRFNGPGHKLLAEWRGRPLVTWAVDNALAAGLDETVVISGAVDLSEVLPEEVTLIENHAWSSGQASSLQVAVGWARHQGHAAIVVGLADQPLVPPEAWSTVAAETSKPIVSATFEGRRRPPVRLDQSIWGLLPVDGDEGARVLMSARPELVAEVACPGQPADVDTVEDLSRWS
ncbi:MAG: nucleotidyltransferase family protein [Acidimicrobiales bacterium]